jgi:hypothetical protein
LDYEDNEPRTRFELALRRWKRRVLAVDTTEA